MKVHTTGCYNRLHELHGSTLSDVQPVCLYNRFYNRPNIHSTKLHNGLYINYAAQCKRSYNRLYKFNIRNCWVRGPWSTLLSHAAWAIQWRLCCRIYTMAPTPTRSSSQVTSHVGKMQCELLICSRRIRRTPFCRDEKSNNTWQFLSKFAPKMKLKSVWWPFRNAKILPRFVSTTLWQIIDGTSIRTSQLTPVPPFSLGQLGHGLGAQRI